MGKSKNVILISILRGVFKMSDRENDILTEKETADYLRVKPSLLQQWRHRKKGPAYVKLEGSIRYRLEDLLEYCDKQLKLPKDYCVAQYYSNED